MRRHSGPNAKSGALGIMRGVDSVTRDGDTVIFTMKDANADFYPLTDYHLLIQPNGGVDNPKAAIGTGPYKLVNNEPGVRTTMERFAKLLGRQVAGLGRPDRVHGAQRQHGAQRRAAERPACIINRGAQRSSCSRRCLA